MQHQRAVWLKNKAAAGTPLQRWNTGFILKPCKDVKLEARKEYGWGQEGGGAMAEV